MTLMTSTLAEQIPTTLIMLGIICAVGCIGNTIVIIIYSTKHDRMTANVFILALAMADSFACVCLMPLTIFIESVEWRIKSVFLCKLYYVINNSFIPFSSLLISAIAFDRYFCICHPFLKIITVARAKQIIMFMLGIGLILGGVSSVCIVVVQHNKGLSNSTEYECTETRMLNTSDSQKAIYHVVQGSQISSYVIGILSVAVLYILIFRSVLQMRERRLQLIGRAPRRQDQNAESMPRSALATAIPPTSQVKGHIIFNQMAIEMIGEIHMETSAPVWASNIVVQGKNLPDKCETETILGNREMKVPVRSEKANVAGIWNNRLHTAEKNLENDSLQTVVANKHHRGSANFTSKDNSTAVDRSSPERPIDNEEIKEQLSEQAIVAEIWKNRVHTWEGNLHNDSLQTVEAKKHNRDEVTLLDSPKFTTKYNSTAANESSPEKTSDNEVIKEPSSEQAIVAEIWKNRLNRGEEKLKNDSLQNDVANRHNRESANFTSKYNSNAANRSSPEKTSDNDEIKEPSSEQAIVAEVWKKRRLKEEGNLQNDSLQNGEVKKHNRDKVTLPDSPNLTATGDSTTMEINNLEKTMANDEIREPLSEQAKVAEIWKNRLRTGEHNPDICPGRTEDIAITNRPNSFKIKYSSIRKSFRGHTRKTSKRALKSNAILLNMKTAGMLFVVAVVYIITFIPAMLMATGVISIYLPVFYLYYVNNGINPIIYCFMNPNFREDVHNFFIVRNRLLKRFH